MATDTPTLEPGPAPAREPAQDPAIEPPSTSTLPAPTRAPTIKRKKSLWSRLTSHSSGNPDTNVPQPEPAVSAPPQPRRLYQPKHAARDAQLAVPCAVRTPVTERMIATKVAEPGTGPAVHPNLELAMESLRSFSYTASSSRAVARKRAVLGGSSASGSMERIHEGLEVGEGVDGEGALGLGSPGTPGSPYRLGGKGLPADPEAIAAKLRRLDNARARLGSRRCFSYPSRARASNDTDDAAAGKGSSDGSAGGAAGGEDSAGPSATTTVPSSVRGESPTRALQRRLTKQRRDRDVCRRLCDYISPGSNFTPRYAIEAEGAAYPFPSSSSSTGEEIELQVLRLKTEVMQVTGEETDISPKTINSTAGYVGKGKGRAVECPTATPSSLPQHRLSSAAGSSISNGALQRGDPNATATNAATATDDEETTSLAPTYRTARQHPSTSTFARTRTPSYLSLTTTTDTETISQADAQDAATIRPLRENSPSPSSPSSLSLRALHAPRNDSVETFASSSASPGVVGGCSGYTSRFGSAGGSSMTSAEVEAEEGDVEGKGKGNGKGKGKAAESGADVESAGVPEWAQGVLEAGEKAM